ncbi:MAG TPA: hypothetical protein VNG12_18840 [Acidimicrobiales bacterium]|nr:hypothetical protein [Acidimicrobiales bacterium]
MLGTTGWLVIAGAAIMWEAVCRASRGRFPGLGRTGSMLARRLPWRVVLIVLWMFAGLHLFARYTVPGH